MGKFKDETELIAFAMIYYPDDEEPEQKEFPKVGKSSGKKAWQNKKF